MNCNNQFFLFKLKKDVADTESYLFGTGLAVNLKTVKIMEHLQWLTSPILWKVPCKMTTQFTQELAMFKVKNMIENHQDLNVAFAHCTLHG